MTLHCVVESLFKTLVPSTLDLTPLQTSASSGLMAAGLMQATFIEPVGGVPFKKKVGPRLAIVLSFNMGGPVHYTGGPFGAPSACRRRLLAGYDVSSLSKCIVWLSLLWFETQKPSNHLSLHAVKAVTVSLLVRPARPP